MDHVSTASRLVVALLALGASASLAGYLVQQRNRPAARPLLGVAVVLTIGATVHLLAIDPAAAAIGLEWVGWSPGDQWWVIQGAVVTVAAAGAWTLFAVEYAGKGDRLLVWLIAAVALLVGVAGFLTVRAARVGITSNTVEGITATLTLTAFLASVGVYLLLQAAGRQNAFPLVEPLLLSVGAATLLSGILLAQILGLPWLYPAAIALASGSFLATVVRYPMLDTLPAARVAGRDRVVEELSAGVIVVDRDGRIRDCNERASSLFDVTVDAVLDDPFRTLPGISFDAEDVATAAEPGTLTTDRGATLELTGSPIVGHGNRSFGTIVSCTDVTERRIREERLAILRRFVVDVVGTRMAEVAASAADSVSDRNDRNLDERADSIWTTTTALTELVAVARDVEQAIRRTERTMGNPGEADLRTTIRSVADAVAEESSHVVSVDLPDSQIRSAMPRPLFETVLRTLLADARQHSRERISVAAAPGNPPTVQVCDDRRHDASRSGWDPDDGLDVPVIRLAVEHAGGSVSVTRRDDRRRCVTIKLPPEGADAHLLGTSLESDVTSIEDRSASTENWEKSMNDRTTGAASGPRGTRNRSRTDTTDRDQSTTEQDGGGES